MRQTLHILKKDLSRLGYYVGVILLLWIGFAWAKSHSGLEDSSLPSLFFAVEAFVPLLLPLTIWFQMVHDIQDEPLPGDRQFWITRPYNRWSLLVSKILFVLLCVNLPLLVSDLCIIGAHRLPLFASIPAVFLRQIFVSAWLIVPLFTLATVTETLPRCGLFILLVSAGILFEGSLLSRHALNNLPTVTPAIAVALFVALLALQAFAVIWQYGTRHTRTSRLVSTTAMVIIGCPLLGFASMGPQLRDREVRGPAPELAFLPHKLELLGFPGADTLVLRIPMQISRLPVNTVLSADGRLVVWAGNRELWETDINSDLSHNLIASRDGQVSYFRAQIKAGVLKKIAAQPVTMHLAVSGTLLHGETLGSASVKAADFYISGIGHCQSGPWMLRMTGAQKTSYQDQVSFECATISHTDYQNFYTVEENGVESDIQGEGAVAAFGGGMVRNGLSNGLPVSAGLSPVETWTLHVTLPPGLKNSQTARIVFRRAGEYSRFNRTITAGNVRFPSDLRSIPVSPIGIPHAPPAPRAPGRPSER